MRLFINHNEIHSLDTWKHAEVVNGDPQVAEFTIGKDYIGTVHEPQSKFDFSDNLVEDVDASFTAGAADDVDVGCYCQVKGKRLQILDTDAAKQVHKVYTFTSTLDADGDWAEIEMWFSTCDYLEFRFLDPYGDTEATSTIAKITIESEHLLAYTSAGISEDLGDVSGERHFVRVGFNFTSQSLIVLVDGVQVNDTVVDLWQVSDKTTVGYEGFTYTDNDDILAPIAYWSGTAKAGLTCTKQTLAGRECVRFRDQSAVNGYDDVDYTFGTQNPSTSSGNVKMYVYRDSTLAESSVPYLYVLCHNGANRRIYIRINVRSGAIATYTWTGAANEMVVTALTMTDAAWNLITITVLSSTTYKITLGTTDSSTYTNESNAAWAAGMTKIRFWTQGNNVANYDAHVAQIVTSWATAGPDGVLIDAAQCTTFAIHTSDAAEDVDVSLYSIKSSNDTALVIPDDLCDKLVQLYDEDNDDWFFSGWITEPAYAGNSLDIIAKDGGLRLDDQPARENMAYFDDDVADVVAGVNTIKATTAITSAQASQWPSKGLLISSQAAPLKYIDDSGGYESLKIAGAGDISAPNALSTSGTYADTQTKNDATYNAHRGNGLTGGETSVIGVLTKASAITGNVDAIRVATKFTGSWNSWTTFTYKLILSIKNNDGTWHDIYSLPGEFQAGSYSLTCEGEFDVPLPVIDYITSLSTTPTATVKMTVYAQNLRSGGLADILYPTLWNIDIAVEYVRVHVIVTNRAHDPIEAPISAIDISGSPSNNRIIVSHAPMIDGYAAAGDLISVGGDVSSIIASAGTPLPGEGVIECQRYRYLSQDFRGMTKLQALKVAASKDQSYWWFKPDPHGLPGLNFMQHPVYKHFTCLFNGQGTNVDIGTTDPYISDGCTWLAYNTAAGRTIKTQNTTMGWVMEALNTTASSFHVVHNIYRPDTKQMRQYEFGICFNAADQPVDTGQPCRVQFRDVLGTVLVQIEFTQVSTTSTKVKVTDAGGTSDFLQSGGTDIIVPLDDFHLFKIKWSSPTAYTLYVKKGVTGASPNDPTFTAITLNGSATGATAHNVVTDVNYLFEEDGTSHDLGCRITCVRWSMEKRIGSHDDDFAPMALDVMVTALMPSIGYSTDETFDANNYEKIATIGNINAWRIHAGSSQIDIIKSVPYWMSDGSSIEFRLYRNSGQFVLYGIKHAAANLNILLNFTNDGNVTTKNGAEVVGTSTLQSWETWKIEILSSTSYKIYKNGALAGTYTPDYAFGAGAQNHYDFCVVNNGAEAGDYYFLWVDHNNGSILSPTREINIQPSGKYLPKANTLNTVTILGKKSGSDDPITVPIRDTTSTLYDPTLDDIGDPDSPRDLYIVDDVLNDQKSLRDKAVAMLELNTTQKYNCIVQPSDQSERPFHVGDVVRFSMRGDMYYNEFVRRVEFEWDVKTGKKNYTLETGLLSTEGMEKVQRMFSATKDRFTAMSIDRR